MGQLPESSTKRWLNHRCYVIAFRILTRSLSAVINIHNKQWRPQRGSICVANHTSPIDCVILSNDNCYSLIGQRHGGILGIIQRALHRASPHIWFERSEARDRGFVLTRCVILIQQVFVLLILFLEVERTYFRLKKSSHAYISGRNLHKQHISNAIQKRQL